MKVKANPRFDTFFANLQGLKRPFARWEGIAFRATPLPHADPVKLLDGKGSFKALSQALGRAAYANGAEGLLAPSARVAGGTNVVYFPDSLVASSEVSILGEEELTRWLRKR